MIVFYLDNWQATDLLKEIITNIYNSFVFVKIFINFRNHFVFFCRFVIHHSIYILWLDNDLLSAKYFNSFHSNSNLSKHSLCPDCHERKIIYHRRRHRNFMQSYIVVFISWSEIYFFSWNAKEDNATNVVFNKINKNIKVKCNDQFSWWRVWVFECSTMTNHVFIFN